MGEIRTTAQQSLTLTLPARMVEPRHDIAERERERKQEDAARAALRVGAGRSQRRAGGLAAGMRASTRRCLRQACMDVALMCRLSGLVIKVNTPPYVLLLDLFDCVDDASLVVKTNGHQHVLHVSVRKRDAAAWPTLVCNESKDVRRERRQASMERKMQSGAALAEKRRNAKYQEEKRTLRAQMAVDDTNR
ncbi:hypothetical protein FI667_g2171, partial [Globisporangium splendens]